MTLCLLFLLALAIVACGREDYAHVRKLDAPGEKIVCLGDSLTEGVGGREGEDYPSVLARQLPYPVMNAGRRGDTTADALARLEGDVLAHDPRLVIVLLGGNDFLRQVPLEAVRQNLEAIVRRIQEHGAMVVLAGMKLGLFTDEYGPIYKEIAEKDGAFYVPRVLDGILSDSKLRNDPVHPNTAGYRVLAERILKEIKPLLAEADRRRSLQGR